MADADAAFVLPLSLSSPPKSAHTRPHASERVDAPALPVRESLFDLIECISYLNDRDDDDDCDDDDEREW